MNDLGILPNELLSKTRIIGFVSTTFYDLRKEVVRKFKYYIDVNPHVEKDETIIWIATAQIVKSSKFLLNVPSSITIYCDNYKNATRTILKIIIEIILQKTNVQNAVERESRMNDFCCL